MNPYRPEHVPSTWVFVNASVGVSLELSLRVFAIVLGLCRVPIVSPSLPPRVAQVTHLVS